MERWNGKVAVVTGAASGMGAAIAERFVAEGLIVVGLDVDIDKLKAQAEKLNGKMYAMRADMSREADIVDSFARCAATIGPVHVLVNNAGVARSAPLTDGDVDTTAAWKHIIDVNLMAVALCSREAIKIMRSNNIDGTIVNINSVMGHYPVALPLANMYAASKFGVTAYTQTLRHELVGLRSGIRVTSVSPGGVRTNVLGDFSDDVKNVFYGGPLLEPADVADAVAYVVATPQHVNVAELIVRPLGERF